MVGTFIFFTFVLVFFYQERSVSLRYRHKFCMAASTPRRDLFPAKIRAGYFFLYRSLLVASDDHTDRMPARSLADGSWLEKNTFFPFLE